MKTTCWHHPLIEVSSINVSYNKSGGGFVSQAPAVMQLLFSVHLKTIYGHKKMTDLSIRSGCISEHPFTFL